MTALAPTAADSAQMPGAALAVYAQGLPVEGAPAAAWLLRHGASVPVTARWVGRGLVPPGHGDAEFAGALVLPVYSPEGGTVGVWLVRLSEQGDPVGFCETLWDTPAPVVGAAVRLGGAPVPLVGAPGAVIAAAASVPEALAIVGAGAGAWPGGWPVWVPVRGPAALEVPREVRVVYLAQEGVGGHVAAHHIAKAWPRRRDGMMGVAAPAAAIAEFLVGHRAPLATRCPTANAVRAAGPPAASDKGAVKQARLPYADN